MRFFWLLAAHLLLPVVAGVVAGFAVLIMGNTAGDAGTTATGVWFVSFFGGGIAAFVRAVIADV